MKALRSLALAASLSSCGGMITAPTPTFSITTVCPSSSDNFWPTRRAKISLPPPAAKPTIKRIGRLG